MLNFREGVVGETKYIPLLIGCLDDTNVFERAQAAMLLARFGPLATNAVGALRTAMEDTSRGQYGQVPGLEAAYALWQVDGETDAPAKVLREFVKSGDPAARYRAAIYLSEVDPSDLSMIPIIVEAVKNGDAIVRIRAANAIDLSMIAIIVEALKNGDTFVSIRAAKAIGRYGTAAKDVVPELTAILDSGKADQYVRRQILVSLRKIDAEAAGKYEKK